MDILIVTFQLNGLSVEEYGRHCAEVAPVFAALPGLLSKLWLADPAANTFGGVYLWENREALERYLASPIFHGLSTNPYLTNVTARSFGTLDEATAITAGPLLAVTDRRS